MSGVEVSEFLQAGDGEEALDLLQNQSEPVDLVLSDINMPKMNGEQFLRAMRAVPGMNEIPVVIVSTDATDSRRARVFALGARGYVTKPVTPEALSQELERVLADTRKPENPAWPVCPVMVTEKGAEPLLNSVTAHALETMCFASLDGVLEGEMPGIEDSISVKMHFNGDAIGWLGLTLTYEAAAMMTANFFGEEGPEYIKPDQVESFAGELANVICGSVLGWCKHDGHFELGMPEVVPDPMVTGADFSTMTYEVEGGAIRVSVELSLVEAQIVAGI